MSKTNNTEPARKKLPPLRLENVRLVWKNFAGAKKQYNAEGLRNFHVVIDEPTAKLLRRDGWNIKDHKAREEGEPDWYSLKVHVRFDNFPPSIILKNGNIRTQVDESMLDILDWAETKDIKLMVNGSYYKTDRNEGVKAYLSRLVATISEIDYEFSGLDSSPQTSVKTDES